MKKYLWLVPALVIIIGLVWGSNYLQNKKIDSRVEKQLTKSIGARTENYWDDNGGVSLRPNNSSITDVSPATANSTDLGTDALPWRNLYAGTSTITVLASSSNFSYVPVNTTSHAARVMIQGAGTENPFSIVTSTAGATSMLTVLTNGNVGINSSSPSAKLAIRGGSYNTSLILDSTSDGFGPGISLMGTRTWDIISTGGSAGPGAGVFAVLDETSGQYRFNINSNGLVSFGTTTFNSNFTLQTKQSTVSAFTIVSTTGGSMLTVLANGNVGINSSTPNFLLSVNGTVAFANLGAPTVTDNLVCIEANGELRQQATNCTVSSARFKENIMSLSSAQLMKKVQALRAVSFDFKAGKIPEHGLNGGGKESSGFIAEEVALIDPMLVVYTDDYTPEDLIFEQKNYPKAILYKNGKTLIPQTVDYARVSVLLTGAIQNMDDRLSAMENGKLPETQIDWLWKSLMGK